MNIIPERFRRMTGVFNEPKWTPGPWRASVEEPPFRIGDCLQGQQIWGRCRIAFTERQNVGAAQEAANAHLIAAAPDLYEALSELLNGGMHKGPCDGGQGETEYPDACTLHVAAFEARAAQSRAALAKARGETK